MGLFDFLKGEETANVDNINQLQAASKELRMFYATQGRPDLVTTLKAEQAKKPESDTTEELEITMTEKTVNVSRDVVDNMTFMLLDNTEGAYFTKDIIGNTSLLSRFQVDSEVDAIKGNNYAGIENYVKICYESTIPASGSPPVKLDDLSFYINKDPNDPTKTVDISTIAIQPAIAGTTGFELNKNPLSPERFSNPSLACFSFLNHTLSPAARLTGPAAMFLTAIPTVEISRCIPFIKITFVSATPPMLGEKTDLSILNFLGARNTEGDGINMTDALPQILSEQFNFTVVTKAEDSSEIKQYTTSVSAAGMELFTSPQTMINANPGPDDDNILNKFAPLMSLESIQMSVTGLRNEMLVNETGNLTLVIHDRSRMSELAPLLAADLFGSTYLNIEYGWSHPDGQDASGNAYGALLNSMRSKGSYNIVATNFGIGNDGQVRCDMRLTNRGGAECKVFPIATGNLMPVAPFEAMVNGFLAKKLASSTADLSKTQSQEIRSKFKVSMDNASSPSTVVSRDIYSKFVDVLKPRQEGTEQSTEDLVTAIEAIVGDPSVTGDTGAIATSNVSLAKEIDNKIAHMQTGVDPWLRSTYPKHIQDSLAEAKQTGASVSLGKLLATFIGAPLAGSGRFDEVQLMMYRFNKQAGAARDYDSLAEFNISTEYLKVLMKEFVKVRPSMSIEGFIGFINKKLLTSPANPNYGLTKIQNELSEAAASADAGNQDTVKELSSTMIDELRAIYKNSSVNSRAQFRIPKLTMYLECLPAMMLSDENDPESTFIQSPDKNILRVHIYDLEATPYEDELFLLAAQNSNETAEQLKGSGGTDSSELSPAADPGDTTGTVDASIGDGDGPIKPPVDPDDSSSGASKSDYIVYSATAPVQQIKDIIKSAVPSITYGEGFSAMNSFNMRSTTSGPVADAMIVNARLEGAKKPSDSPSESSGIEDVTVIPANASMDILGCPILRYGQQFFIDLGTGTTADNLYYITGLEHRVSAGEFSTSVSLGFAGTGAINSFRGKLEAALPGLKKVSEEEKAAVEESS